MSDEIRVIPNGLVTDPSAIVAGDGGLTLAQNIICKRPGLIEPRGSLRWMKTDYSMRFRYSTYAREWDGVTWMSLTDEVDSKICRGTGAPLRTIAGWNKSLRAEQYNAQQMWTFEKLLRCVDNSNDQANCFKRPPGAPRSMGMVCYLDGASPWLPIGYCTAYKSIFVRHVDTSAGAGTSERILIGAPSEAQVVRNTLAVGSLSVKLEVQLPPNTQVGDEIQIYRSPTATANPGDPSDAYSLRYSALVTSGDIAAGYVSLHDRLADGDWGGPSIYTALSEQGPALANYRIRLANDVAYYNGMMFYANAKRSQTIDVNIKSIGFVTSSSFLQSETLVSVKTDPVNWTTGSNVITGVNPTIFLYLAIGQVVTRDLAVNPSTGAGSTGIYGRITALNSGAGTITIDTNATATVVGGTLICWDWFGISDGSTSSIIFAPWVDPTGGTTFDLGFYSAVYHTPIFATVHPGAAGPNFYAAGAGDMERAWSYGYAASVDGRLPRLYVSSGANRTKGISCLFEYDVVQDSTGNADIATAPQFALVSTKPAAFSRPCALTFAASPVKSQFDGNPGRLAWSKSLEPEAVPLGYFADIGDASEPISRIFATTDSLWVLKTDGLWRVYGDGPESLTIQQVDPTVKAIVNTSASVDCSPWAAKLGDAIYAWTRRGIVSISSLGVRQIDGAIATEIKAITPGGPSELEAQPGRPWAAASVRDSIVVFGSSELPLTEESVCYAYHTLSETWATWTGSIGGAVLQSAMTGAGASENGTLRVSAVGGYFEYVDAPIYDGTQVYIISPVEPPLERADKVVNFSDVLFDVDSVSDRTITYSGGSGVPLVGIVFADSDGNLFTVIEDSSPTTLLLDKTGCELGTVTDIWWPQPISFTFSATTEGLPNVEKYFDETCLSFQSLRGGTQYSISHRLRGQLSSSAVGSTIIYDSPDDAGYPQFLDEIRQYVRTVSSPSQQGRGTGIEVTFDFAQARRYFAIDGFAIKLRAATARQPGRR